MLKMMICMDCNKVNIGKKYSIDAIHSTIDSMFEKLELLCQEKTPELRVYRGNGDAKDYGRFGRIVNILKRQEWFMDNVAQWRLYDSDDSDNPQDFNEEDLLIHYQKKRTLGA